MQPVAKIETAYSGLMEMIEMQGLLLQMHRLQMQMQDQLRMSMSMQVPAQVIAADKNDSARKWS